MEARPDTDTPGERVPEGDILGDFEVETEPVIVPLELTDLDIEFEALGLPVRVPDFVPVWEPVLVGAPEAVFVPGSGSERVGLTEFDFEALLLPLLMPLEVKDSLLLEENVLPEDVD